MVQQQQRTGLIILALFLALSIALIVLVAIERNLIWPLIIGFVIVAVAVIIAAAAIVNKVAVPFMDARLKYVDAQLEHARLMLDIQLRHAPPPALLRPAMPIITEVEPFRNSAIQLVSLTRDLLGDDSTKIVSREVAQENGYFRGTEGWKNAVKFLTAYGLVYQIVSGGRNDGTAIKHGMTARELAGVIAPPATS